MYVRTILGHKSRFNSRDLLSLSERKLSGGMNPRIRDQTHCTGTTFTDQAQMEEFQKECLHGKYCFHRVASSARIVETAKRASIAYRQSVFHSISRDLCTGAKHSTTTT